MRRSLSLLLLCGFALCVAAHAVPLKRVNVAEFERLLSAMQGQQDAKVAKLVASLELTERASPARLERWQKDYPGRRSQEAFMILADSSAFLNLPAADTLATPPPDAQTLKAIFGKALDYVETAIARLPNFYATRKTENYQDMPAHVGSYERNAEQTSLAGLDPKGIFHEPLMDAGKSSFTVRYVDGREVESTKTGVEASGKPSQSLTTHGEFGSILNAILPEAARGRLYWGRWEQGASGAVAVFRYWVQAGQTSYQVMIPIVNRHEMIFPAYHGEIGVDPETGAILRVTAIADFPPPDQNAISSIAVEYGAVEIGGKSFICPVHSVALARFSVPDSLGPVNRIDPVVVTRFVTQLNDVAFVDYHQFRAESRIITENPVDTPEPPAPHK